ncbi:hypothetical protein KCU67_g2607, partial [Aureobasidium melanogenum]
MNDCGVFSAHNAIQYMNGEEFQKTSNTKEALEFAIRIRWMFQEAIRGLLLGTEGPNERSEAALSKYGILPDDDAVNRAQARIDALSKVIRKETPDKTKKETAKKHKAGNRIVGQTANDNDRRLSKRQKKIVSPASYLPSCISGIRDLIFRLLSTPGNKTGMTVEELEGPIREMMEHEKFPVPETWNLTRLLRVILDRQTHHFQQDANDNGKWVATIIPARELSARYLNELRAKRCSPTPSPLENPAMLHIFISRYSAAISLIQHEKLDETYEARIKATNALFGAQKQQPETKLYVQGSFEYPMHIRCTLPNIQGTELLRDMLLQNQNCAAALQELSEHAQRTIENDPTFEGQFTYRIIISGLDGGSVNNDSWQDLQQAYPRLRGQLLICDDRGVPDPEDPVVTQKPMLDWATPACLLPKPQRKKGIHKHVVWGMFDIAMLANEWTRRSWAPASRVAGPRQAKIEHDQQLLACRKLLLSNTLLYYYRVDRSIAAIRVTGEFTDPSFIIAQTSIGSVGGGRNDFVVDRCVPELEPFARQCRWGSSHEPIDTWALSDKPPQDDEPLHGFYCDRAACYALEIEECRHAEATRLVTLNKSSLDLHAGSHTQKSKGSDSASSGSAQENDRKYLFICSLWPNTRRKETYARLDAFMHTPDGQLVERSGAELRQLYESSAKLKRFSDWRTAYEHHLRRHNDQDMGRPKKKKNKRSTTNSDAYLSRCTLWNPLVQLPRRELLDPIIHDAEGNFIENDKEIFEELMFDHPGAFKKMLYLLKVVEGHAKAHRDVGTSKKSESKSKYLISCKLWHREAGKKKVALLDPLLHDDKGNFVKQSEKVLEQLNTEHPRVFEDFGRLMAIVTRHEKDHEKDSKGLCKLWDHLTLEARKEVLDPLIHDDEGNFVKRPKEFFKELMKEHPELFNRVGKILNVVGSHEKAHEEPGTAATSEQQRSLCPLWMGSIARERLELMDPLVHDDEGNFVERSEEFWDGFRKENPTVFRSKDLRHTMDVHRKAHETKKKRSNSKPSEKPSSSTAAKSAPPQAQPDSAPASAQTPTKKDTSTDLSPAFSPLTPLKGVSTIPTPGKTTVLPITPKKSRRQSDKIAAFEQHNLGINQGTNEQGSDVEMEPSADSNDDTDFDDLSPQPTGTANTTAQNAQTTVQAQSQDPDRKVSTAQNSDTQATIPKPSLASKKTTKKSSKKSIKKSSKKSNKKAPAPDAPDGSCNLWHPGISRFRRNLLQPVVHDSSNNFVDRGDRAFQELMKNNPYVFGGMPRLLKMVAFHRKAHEQAGRLSDKPVPSHERLDSGEPQGSGERPSPCPWWHPLTQKTIIDLLDPLVHDTSRNFVDVPNEKLPELMDTGLFTHFDRLMWLLGGHRRAHAAAGTLSTSPQLEQRGDVESAADGADEQQQQQESESVQAMEEDNSNYNMDLDAPGDDDVDSDDPYDGIQ